MLPVNKKRVEEVIAGLAKFGKTEAGITRLAYSSTDKAAQMWLIKELEYMNLEVREDVLGNLFLRRPGLDPNLHLEEKIENLDVLKSAKVTYVEQAIIRISEPGFGQGLAVQEQRNELQYRWQRLKRKLKEQQTHGFSDID